MSDDKQKGADAQKNITSWADKNGEFKRLPSVFRNHIEQGGKHPPEKGRYTLYVSLACPWAHRTLIVRKLKGLEKFIDASVVHPFMGALGWSFYPPIRDEDGAYPVTHGETGPDDGVQGVIRDPLYDSKFVRELYFKADKEYNGRFTVPVLWDNKEATIVNNESSEIIRMLNTEFNSELPSEFASLDLYPESQRQEIDALNEWVYSDVSNGVYRSGFATSQKAYEDAVKKLFASLDRLEKIFSNGKAYLVGDKLTEADVRLYTTIVRFDPVYHGHFKCNLGSIRHDFPNLNRWAQNLYWKSPAFKDTTDFDHIKRHYYMSHGHINPTRVVPVGPLPNIESL
ncbi:BZ3500_MvSof-1268-A1-R1_Chr3-1g06014 [Microbotryum saponariae]|uniref:BZ3500_MvSof-1268-A1-R1_Chr3-1g06014 protein n=1 Tax=Microbotryum saponariae TaxID=289078 RepID=A0A2X0LE29_9BASI|nr:BZ3500_MvSof-1268-A1-R1_Chr3-1g06014 [Microbotryum saponariae]SDA05204.1 BZ3501_MvSof-1269-A2-R1_Chr3-1g05684 [Microbotryum saponariae]